MTVFHVFLVAVGLVIIAISYIISEKITGANGQNTDGKNSDILKDLETTNVKDQINTIIKEELDTAMYKTEDRLSQISNEKIMAVSEYSDQILEKINQNHTEAVFLYNMLNEKEDAIKKLYENKNDIEVKEKSGNERVEHVTKDEKAIEKLRNTQLKTKEAKEISETQEMIEQKLKNEQILKLYSEGKSIVEIAKTLEIGQGEIKLVIGLSQGEKV
ncbi:hypothetical protein EDD66_102451 [Mobilisporobacter senegalensis]|uniref:Uncharacterized protein n=1 Tax=Mobilisporobacter senegalensis TaxID=1329262 RepID=A0A3N1XW23_9FIRM|nr:DUF6115 domain-containing protein [Mobilisporobacter senegalensis]ROR30796.1 hypothetical protein EDD66_102451 [Mobilisporobacter senegalensis]